MDELNYEGMSAMQLANEMGAVAEELRELDEKKKLLNKRHELLRKQALPAAMEDEGLTNMTIAGIGRFSLRSDVYASIPAASKEAAFEWLIGTGHGGIIKETVHAGTLKALMKELLRGGGVLPPEDIIKVTPYSMAVLTRVSGDK